MKASPAQRAEWQAQWNSCEAKVRADLSPLADFVLESLYLSVRMKPLMAECYARWYRRCDWDDTLTIEDFPLTALASAVALYRGDSV